ncbi:MAG: hypothetical protein JAY96_16260, partial [Candidatus Thiodiazotropha endolucinida]|nr:hypothetical protein [Candidatus Thiodiazotropha taylori]MCW4249746.1 hypothetical protein [Candidatus Thiodiazotropha endolucinida]
MDGIKSSPSTKEAQRMNDENCIWEHTSGNKEQINNSDRCFCLSCEKEFPASEVTEWEPEEDGNETAICPKCYSDSLIGDDSFACRVDYDLAKKTHTDPLVIKKFAYVKKPVAPTFSEEVLIARKEFRDETYLLEVLNGNQLNNHKSKEDPPLIGFIMEEHYPDKEEVITWHLVGTKCDSTAAAFAQAEKKYGLKESAWLSPPQEPLDDLAAL